MYSRAHGLHLWPRTTVRVLAGPPVDLSGYLGRPQTEQLLGEVTDVVMAAIRSQLGVLRGLSPPAAVFDPRIPADRGPDQRRSA